MSAIESIMPWVIVGSWIAFILVWFVSSFGVKSDIGRRVWWRAWWVRIFLIVAVFEVVGASSGKYGHYFDTFRIVSYNPILALVGAFCCSFGIAFAIWARVHLGHNWSPAPAVKEEHELVTSGPYRFVRHPIYTGILLAIVGSALAAPVWTVIVIIAAGVFVRRVWVEERLMIQQFPNQYPTYKKSTWALIPWVW